MRWPNRQPHALTPGMRAAQKALAGFTPLIDWTRFRRRNLNEEMEIPDASADGFACGDETQAVAWVLRSDRLARGGRIDRRAQPIAPAVVLPGLAPGAYRVTFWDTSEGRPEGTAEAACSAGGRLRLQLPPFVADLALAVRRA